MLNVTDVSANPTTDSAVVSPVGQVTNPVVDNTLSTGSLPTSDTAVVSPSGELNITSGVNFEKSIPVLSRYNERELDTLRRKKDSTKKTCERISNQIAVKRQAVKNGFEMRTFVDDNNVTEDRRVPLDASDVNARRTQITALTLKLTEATTERRIARDDYNDALASMRKVNKIQKAIILGKPRAERNPQKFAQRLLDKLNKAATNGSRTQLEKVAAMKEINTDAAWEIVAGVLKQIDPAAYGILYQVPKAKAALQTRVLGQVKKEAATPMFS